MQKKKNQEPKKQDALAGWFFFQSFSLFLKPVKLDILRCGYFTISIPTLVTWAGSLFLCFCLIFSNFPQQRKITQVSSSPCCNLKWKHRLDFAFHGIFTSETSIENVMNMSLYMYVLISRTWKCHFATKLKTRYRLSHLIKGGWLMFSSRQYCLDFSIFPMFTFQPHLLPNISWWTRDKNDKCLKHMTLSTLVKCNSMIVSVVMPSYPNVTLFPWYLIGEHWTTACTLNMKINHNIP